MKRSRFSEEQVIGGLKEQKHVAKSVQIEGNRMELLTQGPEFCAGYGLFIGNAETVRILGNDMALSPHTNFTRLFAQGIRIWGFIGRHVLVSQNRISMATIGIRLCHVESEVMNSEEQDNPWLFSQNLIEGPTGTKGFKATPAWAVEDHLNRTFRGL